MNEKPILFSGPMIRAILDGRKTMTRRVIKPQPDARCTAMITHGGEWLQVWEDEQNATRGDIAHRIKCPCGQPGDRLWVRETWQAIHVVVDTETGFGEDVHHSVNVPPSSGSGYWQVAYAADDREDRESRGFPWRPSIFMPRWASRLTLEVTAVRVERLQAISEADARAEGIDRRMDGPDEEYSGALGKWGWNPVTAFRHLWDGINAGRGCPWESNPWVWVVAFKLVENRACNPGSGVAQ